MLSWRDAADDIASWPPASQVTKLRLWRSRWTMQVCTVACGKTAVIASGKTFQAVDDGDQQVFDAAVFQLVHDPQPEFGTLVLLEPKPQNFLGAVGAHAERDVDGLVAHQALVADLDPQRVKENQGIDRLQRAGLPGRDLLQHRVSDRADQVGRDVDAIELAQMADDLAGAHPTRIHRDDLVVEPWEPALVLGDQLRVKPRLAVARHFQLDLAGVGDDRLLAITISPIARLSARQG